MSDYDSAPDTLAHIGRVRAHLRAFVGEIIVRALNHDKTKLAEPEKSAFDRETPILSGLQYGSEEYFASLQRLGPALEHHYANTRHHPQSFPDGVNDMTLVDLAEMFCDWAAATERHADGDLERSIQINRERFGISEQLTGILENTRVWLQGRP